ncbi:MAG: glycosyltransferase family 4 protein [Chloroflexaceae bacterium]|nr:glycosyltransferase family 4 protein [Chloroflexaceae bacterium]
MRILICMPQVPFVRGGTEYLVEGLRDALREHGHTVDVISMPYTWHPVDQAVQNALLWRMLELDEVDGVPVDQIICTKFPSYVARHPNKVTWLVHQFRQAYDWYGTPMSDLVNVGLAASMRPAILELDRRGLSESRARYAISRNVSQRLKRYNNIDSHVLYPPSRYATRLYADTYGDYILSCARLDRAKRLDLLLEALAHSRTRARALLVGTGPDQPRLAALAARLGLGERVRFLGFVDDATLIDLYARARAVYYAPIDEDYGFATVEAFGAARPVVTTEDAGGVLEFVSDNVNGFIVPPTPATIAARLDMLLEDAALAERLGHAGQPLVRAITWERVVQALVGPR